MVVTRLPLNDSGGFSPVDGWQTESPDPPGTLLPCCWSAHLIAQKKEEKHASANHVHVFEAVAMMVQYQIMDNGSPLFSA